MEIKELTIALSPSGWKDNKQTADAPGVKEAPTEQQVWVHPVQDEDNKKAIWSSMTRLSARKKDALEFVCGKVPEETLKFEAVMEVEE